MAEAHLTAAVANQVRQLLAIEGYQHLDEVASWADSVRPKRPETAGWHFVDIPLAQATYDPSRDCVGGNCVISKIVEFTTVLANPSAFPNDRLEALKWVVHFVDDIHQPLHAEDHDDKGGNTVKLTYFGASTNLHAIWDGKIIEHATGLSVGPNYSIDRIAVAATAKTLDASVTIAQSQAWDTPASLGDLQSSVVKWALESHVAAQSVAYAKLPSNSMGDWSNQYQAQAWPVVEVQLERAGVRLAKILNEALR